jgi:peptidyl-prolyl cis-trans isomerase C
MKRLHFSLALVLGLALTGCEQPTSSIMTPDAATGTDTAVVDDSAVLARVNGSPVTQKMFDMHLKQRQARRPGDAQNNNRQVVLEEVINLELVTQDAEQQGFGQRTDVQAQLAHQRRALLASLAMQEYLQAHPVNEEDLQRLYDEQFGARKEYKARHILMKTEDEAKDMIAKLDEGADFAELAKAHSTGPSGKNGGDLGWFSPTQMVKPFSEAAAAMEKGKYSRTPVETQFGWHVILLEDVRESTPPEFDQVKEQIRMVVQNQRLQEYLNGLREAAKVEMVDGTTP